MPYTIYRSPRVQTLNEDMFIDRLTSNTFPTISFDVNLCLFIRRFDKRIYMKRATSNKKRRLELY